MKRAAARLGLRPTLLAFLGGGWIAYGQGLLTAPRSGTVRDLDTITHYIPLTVLAWVWIACGVLGLVAAVFGSCPRWQATGFTALSTPAGLWGCAFLAARISGTDSAQGSAAVWLAIAVGIACASGLEEPIRRGRSA